MRTSPPTRIPGDVYESAAAEASRASRTVPQQIAHWARIGRELEASPAVSQRDIKRVLAGDGSYDDLSEREQAIIRAAWGEQMAQRRASLDLAAEFRAAGETWTEADDQGNVVVRGETSS